MSTISVRKPPPVQQKEYMVPEEFCCTEMQSWFPSYIFGGLVWDDQHGEIVIIRANDYSYHYSTYKKSEVLYCPFCGEKLEYVREG